jgi:hypothetical protein
MPLAPGRARPVSLTPHQRKTGLCRQKKTLGGTPCKQVAKARCSRFYSVRSVKPLMQILEMQCAMQNVNFQSLRRVLPPAEKCGASFVTCALFRNGKLGNLPHVSGVPTNIQTSKSYRMPHFKSRRTTKSRLPTRGPTISGTIAGRCIQS